MQPGSDMLLLPDRPKKSSYEAIIEGDGNTAANLVNNLNKKVGNVALAVSAGLDKNLGQEYSQSQANTAGEDLTVAQQSDSKDNINSLDVKGNNNNIQKYPQVSSENGLDFIIEKRDIILENDINNQQYCMPSIEVKFLRNEGSLFFSDLIERLKSMNFPLHNCMLFCWDEKRGMHVFVANDPIPQPHFLPAHLCGIANSIYIKFRSYQQQAISQPTQRVTSYSQQGYSQSNNNSINKQNNNNNSAPNNNNNNNNNLLNTSIQSNQSQMVKEEDFMMSEENNNNSIQGDFQGKRYKKMSILMGGNSSSNLMRGANTNNNSNNLSDKRVKERYIEKVREKVSEWRAMHETGFRDKDGNIQKLNLDQAANYIGISRKTLDDYYLQLRRAEQLGFDFDRNKSEKMGALRKFVKEESKKQGKKGMINENSSTLGNINNNPMEFHRQIDNNNNNMNPMMMGSQMDQSNLSGQHGYNNNNNNNNNLRPFGAMGESDDDNEQSSQDMLLQGSNNTNLMRQLKNNAIINNNNNNFGGNQYMNSIPSNSNSLANNNNNNNSSMASIIKSIHSSHNNNNHNNIGSILGGLGNMSSVSSSGSGGSVNLLSKNSIQSLIGQSNNTQNPLMGIGQQQQQQQSSYFQSSNNNNNNNTATLLTPYNYNQNSQLNFNQQSGGPFYANSNNNHPMMGGSNYMQNGNNNNQGTNSQVLLQAYQSRGSYMLAEGMDGGSNLQNTSNQNMNGGNISNNNNNGNQQVFRNSQNNPATQLFNPGSSFISTIGHSSIFPGGSALHNAEFNGNNQNQQQLGTSEIQVEQRFSNHFSLMQLGGTSQIVEERNSFNFLNSGLSQNNNNITGNNIPENIINSRLSNPSVFQMTEDNNNNNNNNNNNYSNNTGNTNNNNNTNTGSSTTTATAIANSMLNS